MAAGLLTSFLLAPIIFRIKIWKGRTRTNNHAQQPGELSRARLSAAIIGGIVALIYLYYNTQTDRHYEKIGYMVVIGIFTFPLYGFVQGVLYRAHALSGRAFIACIGATSSVVAAPYFLSLLWGKSSDLVEHVFVSLLILLIGVIGFGLSFYLARRLRLYA